ncbi:MAG TPA: hypothetical protein VJV23_10475 [Candidatus Polarisedimenticolia bacterium]|nr:hypothetical protein [Candidatus Polarisedimenticolia bacterium]
MKTLTRSQAIEAIRARLLEMVDDDHSMCRVAGEKGIYCRGFRDLTDEQLRRKYYWLHKDRPLSRGQMEDLADRWQLARQIVDQVPISCDAQCLEKDTCEGWNGFDDAQLARYYRELIGDDVSVSG